MRRTPLFEQLEAYLEQLIFENINNQNYKLPSESMLSAMFNISRITSKRALNNLEELGLIKRIKGKGNFISENAKDLINNNYKKVETSKSLFLNYIIISIIIPDITSLFYIDVLNSILTYIKDKKIIIQIENINDEIEYEYASIRKLAYTSNGLIIFPLNGITYAKEIIKLSLNKLAIVSVDNYFRKTNIPCITSENYEAIYEATNELIKKGCKNIAYLSMDIRNELPQQERYKGFIHALKDNNLEINPEIVDTELTHISIFVDHVLDNFFDKDIDAVIASNCGVGIEISKILIAKDYTKMLDNLIIFDDEFGKLKDLLKFEPKCIMQNASEIGRKAIDMIIEQLENGSSVIQEPIIKIPTIKKY